MRLSPEMQNNLRQNVLFAAFIRGISDVEIAAQCGLPVPFVQRVAGFGQPLAFVDMATLHALAALFDLPYPRLLIELDAKTFSELRRWRAFAELDYTNESGQEVA